MRVLKTMFNNFCRPLLFWPTLFAAMLLTGCATPYPKVDPDFQADWQSPNYQAQAYLIPSAPEALARRIDLIRNAKTFIDITYFSWDGDTVGLMLLDELKQAADRGVQVRLALDDLLVFNETWLAELDGHRNIQIRIFNPFNSRGMGWIGRAADFQINQEQLDNRLHEKYFNIDHQYMILGGRNIGDEYFGYSHEANFYDLDVIFKGNVIESFANNYETLWKSEALAPIAQLIEVKTLGDYTDFVKAYTKASDKNPQIIENVQLNLAKLPEAEFVDVQVKPVFDSLAKLNDGLPYFRTRVERTLKNEIDGAKNAIISTPYIVPTDGEFMVIEALTKNGADVTLVTNSSASNDSLFIPAYYEKHRETLLDMGVDIYEYKDQAKNSDFFYHADSYYHNKTVVLDNKVSYIGSSNFDPRSDFLNIELGLVVYSEKFAEQVQHYLMREKDHIYWHVSRDEDGETQWQSGTEIQKSTPNYGAWHKLPDAIFRAMDGESEL